MAKINADGKRVRAILGEGVGWRKKPGTKFFVDIVAPFLA